MGLSNEVRSKITETLSIKDLKQLETVLGPEDSTLIEIKQLWSVAESYGYSDWIIFDASVVRGLAYYSGIVFEAFDRNKQFRAICGGGRYDGLMTTYGSKDIIRAAGFGMGDVVIIELLKSKNLLPHFDSIVDDIVVPFSEDLRSAACLVASKLRKSGRRVEVQLIPKKKIAWCFDLADRIGASRFCYIAPDEWSKNLIRVKYMRLPPDDPNKEVNIPFDQLE